MHNITKTILMFAGLAAFWATPVLGQERSGVGVRGGIGLDPTQVVIGAQYETEPVLLDNLTFRPNFEAGFGDFTTQMGFNGEFVYYLPFEKEGWNFYGGAGPALNIHILDLDPGDFDQGLDVDDTDVGGGMNFVVGARRGEGFFSEVKLGAWDSPTFRLIVGYGF